MEQMSRSARHLLHFSGSNAGIVIGRSPVSADASSRRSDSGTSGSKHLLADSGRSALRVAVAVCVLLAGVIGGVATTATSSNVVEHSLATSIDEFPAALPSTESMAQRTATRRRRVRQGLLGAFAGVRVVRLRSWFLPAQRHRVPPVWRGPPVLRI
jgi:hypothetical protein